MQTLSTLLRRTRTGAVLLLCLFALPALAEDAKSFSQLAMEKEWNYMLGGTGEWRTPNPDYADPKTTPKEFAVRFRWGPHKQHVVGELLGIFPGESGEKEVLYWNFYSFYNPVTEETTLMQVGWNGSIGVGPFHPLPDGPSILDQIFYGIDGSMKAMRHQNNIVSATEHTSDVYERDENGVWKLKRGWTWTRKE